MGADQVEAARGVAVDDYDNDGWLDCAIAVDGGNILLHNVDDGSGGRRFDDVSSPAGIDDDGNAQRVAWLDYDSDSNLRRRRF